MKNIKETIIAEGNFHKSTHPEISRADVNLSQLKRNLEIIRGKLKHGTKMMVVTKGDAYGHGLVPIGLELEKLGCDAIGVVRLTEAIALRDGGVKIPIIILAPTMPSQASWIVKYDITPMVDNENIVRELSKSAKEYNKKVNVHVKVNTGLNRYGIEARDSLSFFTRTNEHYPNINIEGIYTHFRDAEYNREFTLLQLKRFNAVLDKLEREGLRPPIVHAAGSAGILMYPESHMDMVRCGIILYGIEHKEGEKLLPEGVKPLMTLKSRILKIDKIKAGEAGGYGNSFIAKRDSVVATIGVGYADGVSRGWKEILVAGQRVPVVNYFMDGILVDITDIKNMPKDFDEVVIVGQFGAESISWEEACHSMRAYIDEQFQRITERIPKNYFYES